MKLAHIALIVRDYDEAITWYCNVLGFELIEDTKISSTKRWVLVSPGKGGANLLLAKAASGNQSARVGDQTGGRVFLFLNTDNFDTDHQRMNKSGVKFLEEPRSEAYGQVVVFEDLYGNKWDLIEAN